MTDAECLTTTFITMTAIISVAAIIWKYLDDKGWK